MKRKLTSLLLAAIAVFSICSNSFAKEDITSTYLTDANLQSLGGWTLDKGFGGNGYTAWNTSGDVPVIEFYHSWSSQAGVAIGSTKTFNFSQKVSLPAGYYRLAVNAFYREGNGNGKNEKAYIYAGEKKQNVVGLASNGVATYTGGNDLLKAANAFSKGDFSNEFDFSFKTDTVVEIGFHGYIDTYCSWCILGPVTLWKYTAADYIEDYRKKVKEAEALYSTPMNKDVLQDLKDAAGKESQLVTVDDVYQAVNDLVSAISDANTSINLYKSIKEYIDKGLALDEAGQADYFANASVVEIKAAYDNKTLESLSDDQKASLDNAVKAATLKQTAANSDMTALIVNYDFMNCFTDAFPGWTIYNPNGGNAWPNGSHNVEYWKGSAAAGEFDYYQVITGLPVGTYKVTAKMWNSMNGVAGDFEATSGVYGTSNGTTVYGLVTDDITNDQMKEYSTGNIVVLNGELRLGVKNSKTMVARWFGVDWIKLTLVESGLGIETYASIFNTKYDSAKALLTKPMHSKEFGALQEAVKTYDGVTYSDKQDYIDAIAVLDSVTADANATINKYKEISDYIELASTLDDAAKAEYAANATVVEVKAAFEARTIEELTDDQKSVMNAAYIEAVKAQTTPNSDMTAIIVNPSFETGNYDGWETMVSDDTGAKPTGNDTYKMTDSDGKYLFNTWQTGYGISQTINGIRPGKYTLSAVMATDAGQDLVIYANATNNSQPSVDKGTGVKVSVNVTVTTGSLTITAGTKSSYWYKVDDFHLTFNEPVSFEDYYAQISELADSAKNITNKQSEKTAKELSAMVSKAENAVGKEKELSKLQALIKDLNTAITATWVSVKEYELGAEYNAANVGPDTQICFEEAELSKWTRTYNEEGTIGDWHKNTWSSEGENDGSDMKTPFLEDWVTKGQILSDATFTHAAADGLKAGFYRVSLLGRIYNENGSAPNGAAIFKVNEKYVNMIATGTSFEHKGMPGAYGTYEILVKVEEGGSLRSSVTIAGVDFNWISFKNFKVEYLGINPTAITFDKEDMRIKRGDSVTLAATVAPEGASQEVVWTSSNEEVATVDNNGKVTAIIDGTAVITATSVVDETISASLTITVAYPAEPANATFDIADDMKEENISGGTTANSLAVSEWTSNGGAAWSSSAVIKYGSAGKINGAAIPATDKNGNEGGALGISAGWNGEVAYTQRLMLPAGTYQITVDAYNANTKTDANSLVGFITEGGEKFISTRTSYPSGKWVKDKVSFTLEETTIGDIQIGIAAGNTGSGNVAKVFFDNVKIVPTTLLAIAQEDKLDAIAELLPIGDDIFQYTQASIDSTIQLVNAAESVEAVEAIDLPTMILPEADKAYMILDPASENYLNIASDGVRLSRYSQELYFVQTEGGFLLSNGTEYVAYNSTNTWGLVGNNEGSALTFVSKNGAYTIKGKNGYLGYDKNEVGSSIYGDKAETSWTITDFVQSDFVVDNKLVIASYETIVADRISIDLSIDNPTTAVINNGTVKANSVSLNFDIPNNKWSFVMFPFDVPVSELQNTQEGTQWQIRKYDAAARAKGYFENVWAPVTADATLVAGQGYIIQSRRGAEETSTFTFTSTDEKTINAVFCNKAVEMTLAANESTYAVNAGWNLVGNPYLSYFDKSYIQNTTAPITVWDSKNETYSTYTKDDDFALAPYQAFFIQTAEECSIVFGTGGRQTTNVIASGSGARSMTSNRELYNLSITDGIFTDMTRVVVSADASLGYEIGRDASKFMSTNANVPQIYSKDASANYSVNERPMADGAIKIGAYFGHDGEYTISAENISTVAVLEDKLTGETIVLGNGTDSYTFTATAGTADDRFVLYVGEGAATAIASVNTEKNGADDIFTLQGVKVSKAAAQRGIYIVNGKKVMKK